MIEEYERKINKTKSLLEEEKKKVSKKGIEKDEIAKVFDSNTEGNIKSTPEFKNKKEHTKVGPVEEVSLS